MPNVTQGVRLLSTNTKESRGGLLFVVLRTNAATPRLPRHLQRKARGQRDGVVHHDVCNMTKAAAVVDVSLELRNYEIVHDEFAFGWRPVVNGRHVS